MLSKNNHQLQAQKLEAKQQHFAIKKLTIGVASVLISSTFAMYAGSHTAMAAETAPQSDTASEKTDSNKQNMKKEVVLNSAKPETTKETPAKAPAKLTAEVSSAESATTTAKATQTEHSQVESQPQAKPATAASSSAVVSKPQENTNVQPQSKPAVTTTPVVSAPKVAENTVARPAQTAPAQTAPAQTAPTQATPAVQAQKSPQWQADATKAVDNKTGLYTPQLSYNAKWYSMSVDPGRLTPDVMKGNSIPFTAVNHRGNFNAISSADYKLRVQLDDRLVDKVADISISPADTVNEVVHFKRVYNDAQKPTNIWEANVVYKQGGIFGGLLASAGKATMARNGKIMLNDTLENIYPKLPNIAKSPLVYNAYVYDNSSRTALLSTNNEGYIVGPNDPLAEVPVTSDFGGKFMGANSTVSYDPTVGKNGALIVYYQAEKSSMWSYSSDWNFKLHYAIDPALLPYIEKNNGAYTVELDKATDGWGADGSYGFEQVTDPKNGKALWKRTAYLSRLEHKVADLPLNLDGTGVFDPTNMADYVQFNNAMSVAGRPVMVRLVYHLNKKPEDIYTDMLKKGTAGGNLLFSQYYGDSSDTMQNYSLATSMLTFNDSDGDTLPDLKEESVFTNPHVSMPNVSNAYGTENKVHGQLVFSNVEKNTQHVTVEDKTGKVLGETDVQPVRFNGLAKALPFEVELTGNVLAANSNLVVRVLSKLDGNGVSTENEEPQETALKVKVGPVAASGFTYPLNAVFLQDPKELITNVKELPANATYTFVKKPDLSTSGMKNAVVKVSFPDQYDPSYLHEMEVNVPVKVEDVDLKAGKFTLKPLVMHVNEVNDDMRPLPVEELQSWQETDGKKTLSGDPLWSLVKSVTWSQSPSTKHAGTAQGVVTVTTKDDKTTLANVPVNIIGATAKQGMKTPWGTSVTAKDMIANTTELAQFGKVTPLTYTWKTPLNVTPAESEDHVVHNTVVVDYGDKTTQEVPVTVTVGPSLASKFKAPLDQVTVHYGQVLDPATVLTSEQKAQAKVSKVAFAAPVTTTTLGDQQVATTLTFADGSTASVSLPVQVLGATARTGFKTPWNVLPAAQTLVDNVSALAKYTPTYAWQQQPNVIPGKNQTHVVSGVVNVTYGDGAKQQLPVSFAVEPSAAEKLMENTRQVYVPLTVNYGAKVDPAQALSEVSAETQQQLKLATAKFTVPVQTTELGTKDYPATLSFTDGSNMTAQLPVKVVGAQVKPVVKTTWGVLPDAGTVVSDPTELTKFGPTYTWKVSPVTTPTPEQSHQTTGTLQVTFADGAKQEVPVSLTVAPSMAEVAAKALQTQLVEEDLNANVPATDAAKGLTAETKQKYSVTAASFDQVVDTSKVGEKDYTATVSFADGSTTKLPLTVKVVSQAEKYSPVAKQDLTAKVSEVLEPAKLLDPSVSLPTGTKASWKTRVDTTKAGHQTGEVEVTYPDGSNDLVPVAVKVGTDAQAVTPKAKSDLKVALDSKLTPEAALDPSVALPTGTKVNWKTPVDTTKAGHQTGEVEVTYPDGSKDEVPVLVKVGTDAQATTPKAKADLKVALGGKLLPEEVLDPSVTMPAGTKLSWKTPVDTTKAGHQTSELEVTYPDGSKDEVSVPVKVGTDAQALAPKAKSNLEVALGSKLMAEAALDPSVVLPTGTKVNWKTPVDTTKAGHQTGKVEVTYPDGSKDEVSVPVKVGTDARATTPKAKADLKVALGGKLLPEEVLDPSVTMPAGTKVNWKTPVDTTKAGHQTGEVEVTYPDGSKDEVSVPVKVGTDAQAVTPKAKANLEVALGAKLTPEEVLDPSVALPTGTKSNWKTPVDTNKVGHQTGKLEVTYPDGSKDEVSVPVKVGTDAQAVTPKAKANLEVALGSKLTPEAALDPSVVLPTGATVTWKTPVETTKAGHQTGELEVTYPDGSQDKVSVPVKVGTDAQAVMPKVKTNLKVDLGSKLAPEDTLDSNVTLPAGAKVSWKTPVDTTKAGHQTGELEVTYPDGSQDEVSVPVKVGTDAQALTPKAKSNLEVALDSKLTPEATLDPSVVLPTGTKVSWKTSVDTTKAGHQTGKLEVTYPDDSKDEVSVPVKVGTDAQALAPKAKVNLEVALGSKLTPEEVLDPSVALPTGTKLNWKDPVNTTKAGHQTGELEVTYPDGSQDVVKVSVKVGTDAQATMPEAKPNLEVSLGSKLTPEEVLDPSVTLPTGTKVSWKTSVDTTKAGHQTGEVEVTYPDGSQDVVKVPVKVGTDDEALTPVAKNDLEVKLGSKLTPEEVLDPSVTLPAGTKLNWKVPVDTTKAGHQTGELEVTYPDGSKDLVKVPVKVGTDAQATTPKAKPNLEVSLSSKLTPEEVLDPSVALPTGTKLNWKTPVDTTKAGHQTGELEVTYPDSSKDLVKVSVKVGTDAQALTPKAKVNLEVALGSKLTPEEVLDPSVVLPVGTKLNWKTSVDTTKAGHQTGELEVTYPDGSKDLVKVPVKVGTDDEAVTPVVKSDLEVKLGSKLTPEEVLDPNVVLPVGTKLSWKTPVDTTKASHQTGELEVTYPDGSQDLVKVPVKVGTDADLNDLLAKAGVIVKLHEKVAPQQLLVATDKLPKGTEFVWAKAVDADVAGNQTGEVKVVYPDKSSDVVDVTVKVQSVADQFTPTAVKDLVVTKGTKLVLADLVTGTLPAGSQLNWTVPVDTEKLGMQLGKLEVVYADGSKDQVSVSVKVVDVTKSAKVTHEADHPQAKAVKKVVSTHQVGHKQHAVATVENTKQVLPQTGETTSKNTSLVGLVLLMLLGLFNFGVDYDKKKH